MPRRDLAYLSPQHVAAAVRRHQAAFVACQALAELEARRAAGSVTVGWLVEADGRVLEARVGRSSFGSARVNACILGVASAMSFPASPARTEVSWTVRFAGGASGPFAEAGPSGL